MRLSKLASLLSASAFTLAFTAFGCAATSTDDVGTGGNAATASTSSLDASALGTWSLEGGGTTGTIRVSSVAPFRFTVSLENARTLHTGDIADATATVVGKVATFTDEGCKLALRFEADVLKVAQTGDCAGYFGSGIRADGVYQKSSVPDVDDVDGGPGAGDGAEVDETDESAADGGVDAQADAG